MELKQLLEQRASIGNEMNGLVASAAKEDGRSLNAEELERFDRMDGDFKALGDKIETLKRVERAAELAPKENGKAVSNYRPQTQITRQDRELAFKAWALSNGGKEGLISRQHMEAVHKVGVNLNDDTCRLQLADKPNDIQRNQSSGINSEGGYLQNDGLFQGLERNLKWFGGSRQVAKVIRTDTGEPLSYAFSDDTSNVGVRLGQNTAVSNVNVVYQKKSLGEYTYTSGVFPVSVQLLQDARIDVSADVGEALGIRLARIQNTDFTNGNGASEPFGFMSEATVGTTTPSSPTVIAYDDLVNALFSMDKAYRDQAVWTMSDSTMSALWQIVDLNLRPLFWNQLSTLADGGKMRLLDHDVIINNDMPSIGSAKKPIALIVPDKFIIRDVKEATVIALRERYMDQLAVGFIAYLRSDCKLLNPNCCKVLAMHS